MERRDTDASAGEGEERRRVKVHAEWQRAGCSGSHEKGKFTRIYFADTINFPPPPHSSGGSRKLKNGICNIVYPSA